MSKVSDALRRASEDSGQKIARAIDEREQKNRQSGNGESQTVADELSPLVIQTEDGGADGVDSTNDHDFHAFSGVQPGNGRLVRSYMQPKQRFKETIENLIFGRDLAKVEAYPLVALGQSTPAGEHYKILREQINKVCRETGCRSILVTSPVKGDGKTTVAANLAAAMALDYHQQVLLIDADLRSPSIHRYFGINATPGLAEYLNSNASSDLVSYVQNTALPGLRILPGGAPSVASAELLVTDKMQILLKELPEIFPGHRIIVDTSPVISTSDPLVLSRLVEGIVMVVRAGKTPRACLSAAFKSLGSSKVMGIVLNGTELGVSSRYYRYAPIA